jgi:hypothetical protein
MGIDAAAPARPVRTDLKRIGWRVGVGLGAGALVGFLVTGPLARLLMFTLRLTSPEAVRGVTSDDGFTIGVFSADTLFLLTVCAGLGAVAGIGYACFRAAVHRMRVRLVLWTALCTLLVGADLVRTDGVDFVLLEPAALAVAGFVALPGLTGLLIALLVERWSRVTPGRNWATAGILAPGVLSPPAIVVAVLVGGMWLALSRLPGALPARFARVAVPAAAVAAIVLSTIDLARDIDVLF